MERKKSKWFSFTIFKESFKSNFVSLLIVGVGNALIALVVILILSTLSLNTTKQSMLNMFNTADMEHSLKQASAGAYIAFDGTIEAHETILPEVETYLFTAYEGTSGAIDLLDGSYNRELANVKGAYDVAFAFSTGSSDDEKHDEAKTKTLAVLNTFLDFRSMSDIEKEFIDDFIGYYLDEAYQDNTLTNDVLIENALYSVVDTYITQNFPDSGISADLVMSYFEMIQGEINSDGSNKEEVIKENIINIISFMLPGYSDAISGSVTILLDAYLGNTDAYNNNTVLEGDEIGYKDKVYYSVIEEIINSVLADNLIYEFLPDFEVDFVTNELGEPIYFEEKTVDGVTQNVEVVITSIEDRDKLIPVKENMGLYSNFLEKMHKEIITGEPYTEEEIATAKQESQEYLDMFSPKIYEFYKDFLANKTNYIDETTGEIKKDYLIFTIGNIVYGYAEEIIPSFFNVDSLDEIKKETIGLDGKELLNKAYDYSISAIAVFEEEQAKEIAEGRDMTEALLIALNRASSSLIDELPADISFKLSDLASRNLYGLVVGVILFSIAGLLLPIVYSILTANSLVAQQVESGSLAFTLSSPIRRKTIIISKAIYLIFAITSMYILLFLFALIAREIGIAIGGVDFIESLTIKDLFFYTIGSFSVSLAISGICFLSSSIFNKTKYSIGVGGGISVFFLVSSILGLFGSEVMPLALRIDSMNFFNYLTIIKLFDVQSILDGTNTFFYLLIPLLAISVVTYLIGYIVFTKKDLPL